MKKILVLIAACFIAVAAFAEVRIATIDGIRIDCIGDDAYIGTTESATIDFFEEDSIGISFIISHWQLDDFYGWSYFFDAVEMALGIQYTFNLGNDFFIRPTVFAGMDICESSIYKRGIKTLLTAGGNIAVGSIIWNQCEVFINTGLQFVKGIDILPFQLNVGLSYTF